MGTTPSAPCWPTCAGTPASTPGRPRAARTPPPGLHPRLGAAPHGGEAPWLSGPDPLARHSPPVACRTPGSHSYTHLLSPPLPRPPRRPDRLSVPPPRAAPGPLPLPRPRSAAPPHTPGPTGHWPPWSDAGRDTPATPHLPPPSGGSPWPPGPAGPGRSPRPAAHLGFRTSPSSSPGRASPLPPWPRLPTAAAAPGRSAPNHLCFPLTATPAWAGSDAPARSVTSGAAAPDCSEPPGSRLPSDEADRRSLRCSTAAGACPGWAEARSLAAGVRQHRLHSPPGGTAGAPAASSWPAGSFRGLGRSPEGWLPTPALPLALPPTP
jgi:hypothetical protein